MLVLGALLNFAFVSFALTEALLTIGSKATPKPDAGSVSAQGLSEVNGTAATAPQNNILLRRDSLDCCDCAFEGHGLAAATGGSGIDFGDNSPNTITSWITHPFNTQGCGGNSYSAFNLWGLGYGRWQYDHYDVQFYLDRQYNAPRGSRVIQWQNPLVRTSSNVRDASYNTPLFTALVIRASDYVVLSTCTCYSRFPSHKSYECIVPEACCYGATCTEDAMFQCIGCNSIL